MDMTKGNEKGRSNAPPSCRYIINNKCLIEQYAGYYCPTTFSCTVFIGLSVIRLTLSRLLSSAMLA